MQILHILNGDATVAPFAAANQPGTVMVWRELLAEGPVGAPSLEAFWALRETWLNAEFGDRQPGRYADQVVREYDLLARLTDYDEVVLWFEQDVVCQINLVFLLNQIRQIGPGKAVIKGVSVAQLLEDASFKGLGQLTGAQLATLYLQAETLTPDDLAVAAQVWGAYAGTDPEAIQHLVNEADFGHLLFLKDALRLHLQRFPFVDNGLNLIERQLAVLLMEGPMPEPALVGRFLAQDRVYGLGDWSVEQYIEQGNHRLWQRGDGAVSLTEVGADVMTGRRANDPVERWLGGYHQTADSPYRWSEDRQKLTIE